MPIYKQTEDTLKGSTRLGIDPVGRDMLHMYGPVRRRCRDRKRYELSNHLGNVLAVVSDRKLAQGGGGNQVSYFEADQIAAADYYPYGQLHPGRYVDLRYYRYGYNGKEREERGEFGTLTHYDYGFRVYSPGLGRFWSVDPLAAEYAGWSGYVYVMGNPLRYVDVEGLDTIDIVKNAEGKWVISKRQIVEGDDVFRVKDGDVTKTYTFSEGEYGKRILVLNLENTKKYTLGIYHISGKSDEKATGYVVTPGGEPSTEVGSGKRLPDDVYTLAPTKSHQVKWVQPWIQRGESVGDVSKRGVKIHPVASSDKEVEAVKWTAGCFIVCTEYIIRNNGIYYNSSKSKETSKKINTILGATKHYEKVGTKNRPGSDFSKGIDYKLIQKSAFK